uniref:(northern house mosquito) hypothetical protein n=1 Tax=Culex pipiens TaxID=7175 RepID=A0A8D8C8L3_CULPI
MLGFGALLLLDAVDLTVRVVVTLETFFVPDAGSVSSPLAAPPGSSDSMPLISTDAPRNLFSRARASRSSALSPDSSTLSALRIRSSTSCTPDTRLPSFRNDRVCCCRLLLRKNTPPSSTSSWFVA